jgi:hypothetical protein
MDADLPVADWRITPAGRLLGHIHRDVRTSGTVKALTVEERIEALTKWSHLLGAPIERLSAPSVDTVWSVEAYLRGVRIEIQINLPSGHAQDPPKPPVELAADELGGELLP